MFYATTFTVGLCVLQFASGTPMIFTLGTGLFVLLSTLAFNVGGGFMYPSGAYAFFFSTLTVILGVMAKVVFWESATSQLRVPTVTIAAYDAGALAILGCAYLSSRFRPKQGLLQNILALDNYRLAMIGCLMFGVGIPLLAQLAYATNSTLFYPFFTAFLQFNEFLPMAIILGACYEIRRSGGRRSINVFMVVAASYSMFFGVFLSYSKQALFFPLVCWLAACASLRYRFSRAQVIAVILAVVFFSVYIVPFCQQGKAYTEASTAENWENSIYMITHLAETKQKYDQQQGGLEGTERLEGETPQFFDRPQGLFDRLVMINMDDRLVEITQDRGPIGLDNFRFYFLNLVPRIFWPSKPYFPLTGNTFAHEIGMLGQDDTTTGISFSAIGEAYHEATWVGVLIVAPSIWLSLFLIMDSLCGDVRKAPWGLLIIALFSHVAPEGMLQATFYTATFGAVSLILVAGITGYLLPLVAAFVAPPKRQTGLRGTPGLARPSGRTTVFGPTVPFTESNP
jgi:hypothetical protein